MATKKKYSVKLSAIARDLDRALKALAKIEKKKATLAPDDARDWIRAFRIFRRRASWSFWRAEGVDRGFLVGLGRLIAQARWCNNS